MDSKEIFRSMSYIRHNQRRLEHLAGFGFELHNKTVLELGAGIGDHTHFYLDRGCRVISLEAREENVQILREEFSNENVDVYQHDLETPFLKTIKKESKNIDYIHCYGLLYHLKNPMLLLDECAALKESVLLLETCVSDGCGEHINVCNEKQSLANQSFSGQGCRPTREWVFNNLKRKYSHVYMSISQPNHKEFPLEWNSDKSTSHLTRAVFVASNTPVVHPLLAPFILHKHTNSF